MPIDVVKNEWVEYQKYDLECKARANAFITRKANNFSFPPYFTMAHILYFRLPASFGFYYYYYVKDNKFCRKPYHEAKKHFK